MVSTSLTVTPAGSKSAATGAGATPGDDGTAEGISALFATDDAASPYNIFPNPGNGNVTIRQRQALSDEVQIKIISYTGEVVHENTLQLRQGLGQLTMDLPPGIYLAELKDKTGEPSTVSMVIKK
jgi:hypothetical protein